MGTLANSADPDEMQHGAAFHLGLHSLLRLQQPSGTDKHHNFENSTCDPLKYTMVSPIFIVSICMRKSIRIQRFNTQSFQMSHFVGVQWDIVLRNLYLFLNVFIIYPLF